MPDLSPEDQDLLDLPCRPVCGRADHEDDAGKAEITEPGAHALTVPDEKMPHRPAEKREQEHERHLQGKLNQG